jgi:hypothetical protein
MGAIWSLFVLSIGVFSCKPECILRKLYISAVELYPTLQCDQYEVQFLISATDEIAVPLLLEIFFLNFIYRVM